jgi:S-adenosylmethionine-diacylglycerol 3-amino-3-carboxypropyl transferase
MFRDSWPRGTFYFRGSSGLFAWLINVYINRVARMRDDVDAIFNASDLEEQRHIYLSRIKPQLWGPAIRWLTRRDCVLAMLGVPRSQRRQIDQQHHGGIAQYIEDQMDVLFTQIPLRDNYFWRVYATGQYSPNCCPEYLKEENFFRLKSGLVDRLSIHTCSVLDFLRSGSFPISRFSLLDHMDWLCERHGKVLRDQWQAISDRSAQRTRIIWRSASLQVDFVDSLTIQRNGKRARLADLLHYHRELAASLHTQDRVHTYGSFYIAEFADSENADAIAVEVKETRDNERCWSNQNAAASELVADPR